MVPSGKAEACAWAIFPADVEEAMTGNYWRCQWCCDIASSSMGESGMWFVREKECVYVMYVWGWEEEGRFERKREK